MIIGSDKLIEWVRANDSPYWRIMRGEKGGVIIQSDMRKTLTVDDSIPRLDQALKMIGTGTYFVDNWADGVNQNSRFKTSFIMNQNDNIGAINLQPQNIPDVHAEVEKALKDYKRELELERLKAENEELKSEVDSATFRILNRVEPYLPGIIEGVFPNAKAISGTHSNNTQTNNSNTNTVEATKEEQERLDNALSEWSEKDPELIPLIERIAKLSKSDPATYLMAKNILMKK